LLYCTNHELTNGCEGQPEPRGPGFLTPSLPYFVYLAHARRKWGYAWVHRQERGVCARSLHPLDSPASAGLRKLLSIWCTKPDRKRSHRKVSAVRKKICFCLVAWMFFQSSRRAQSVPDSPRSRTNNEISSSLVAALSRRYHGPAESHIDRLRCRNSYVTQAIRRRSAAKRWWS
jgi:hypothetical protein